MLEKFGAVSITRGDIASQSGHALGFSYSTIGRTVVNGPQPSHMYS